MPSILIVDDDPAGRAALRVVLEFQGHEVTMVQAGAAAVEAIRNSSVDLMVLDMILPDMNGHEVIESVRQHADVPVLAMSGFVFRDPLTPEEDVLAKAMALGACAALRKPFKAAALLNAIDDCLKQHPHCHSGLKSLD